MTVTETAALDTTEPAAGYREGVRLVAEAGLRQEGPAVIQKFRRIADTADDEATRRSFLEFAEEAEELLAEGIARNGSSPRPGYDHPETARESAIIFYASGITGDQVRDGIHPYDELLTELADAIDAIDAEGLDQAACRELLGMDPLPAGGAS